MFSKILIANRGEIACRVMATCRRLGVKTVAVYSDADAGARHVAMADEAVHIGPPAVAESYLQGARIIDAALATGAEAIHPGYGFLSENPDFVEAVGAAGLVFIGPDAAAIRAMGLKDAAKDVMAKAGVPVVPGYHGEHQEPDFLAEQAEAIGYPVLIKARAGGGGKGMRLVERPEEFARQLEGAQREAQASFGDPVCLLEKYVTSPRHIEIQVFGDGYGNAVHLFERDCSLQRRHQKVIEEAPAPGMSDAVRAAMGEAAVNAARAIGYSGAGTVEFIADGSGALREDGFWFMEMNTRLQVEHPVSEAITGLDFVELQLRVASGEPLPFEQDDLAIDGWAFEARVYAEDVPKGFLPATGSLAHLSFPAAAEFAPGETRIDSGVRQGGEISPWYDPMIAKVICHGPTRETALNRLSQALEASHVVGCVTNLEFLGALARHAGFAGGEVDTGLIARDLDGLMPARDVPPEMTALAALQAAGLLDGPTGDDPWEQLTGWRHWDAARVHVDLVHAGEPVQRDITILAHGHFRVDDPAEGGGVELRVAAVSGTTCAVTVAGKTLRANVIRAGHIVSVNQSGRSVEFSVPDPLASSVDDATGGNAITAPMPGLVKVVSAGAGESVKRGDGLVVLEAMKMEHTLTAPRDGTVAEVMVAVGDQVSDGTVLVVLEAGDE
ncbi:biotin carboxylase N-terminal domain-containing protein [Amaricoccus tamworthensis]|uniref:ATP-binding protein n=1 Tax=Amaricoccus tamworthensis TaxID=57002 RepID=UPI003C7CE13E